MPLFELIFAGHGAIAASEKKRILGHDSFAERSFAKIILT